MPDFQISQFEVSSHRVRDFIVDVPAKTTLDELLKPTYWARVAHRATQYSTIQVIGEDGVLDVELRVTKVILSADKRAVGLEVAPLRVGRVQVGKTAAKSEKDEVSEIRIDFVKTQKWRVLHKAEILEKGIETEELAEKKAADYRKLLKVA